MRRTMFDEHKFLVCNPDAAAAQTDLDGAVIDMTQGMLGAITLIAHLGDVAAGCVLELTLRGSANADGSGSTEIATTGTLTAGASDVDDKLMVLDVIAPQSRYVFSRLKRGTANAAVNSVIALGREPCIGPITQAADLAKQAWAVRG